jgi:hypothetical protein
MVERDDRGRFVKGHAGGPGRPAQHVTLPKLRDMLGRAKIDQLIAVITEQALGGCTTSQRLLFERLYPAMGAREQAILEQVDELKEMLATAPNPDHSQPTPLHKAA